MTRELNRCERQQLLIRVDLCKHRVVDYRAFPPFFQNLTTSNIQAIALVPSFVFKLPLQLPFPPVLSRILAREGMILLVEDVGAPGTVSVKTIVGRYINRTFESAVDVNFHHHAVFRQKMPLLSRLGAFL